MSPLFNFFLALFILCNPNQECAEAQPSTTGFQCNSTQSYPCRTYVFYRAAAPDLLDLAAIGDLFSVSRLMIAEASNISSPNATLQANQPLFVPISCSCNTVNSTFGSISYAPLDHTIVAGDTFYGLSSARFQNLTTYQSVEAVNPTLVATNLQIGQHATFPVFCKCPNSTDLRSQRNFLVTYTVQPGDSAAAIAATFGTTAQSIVDANGNSLVPSSTIFVPVSRLPSITRPTNSTSPPPAPVTPQILQKKDRKGAVIGLGVSLGISLGLLALILGFWVCRGRSREGKTGDLGANERGRPESKKEEEKEGGKDGSFTREMEISLMADVSDCLDKYRVYRMEQLWEATEGFDEEKSLIEGSVYRGAIDGQMLAIKKLKWNAREELKILQKVNHGNLVRLEGFCIDSKEANCYLVYEYVENGSLHSWLHGEKKERLSWKTRLSIVTDVANGLQYIHEHTRPRVVHKDIKTSNVLLDANMRAKIANFGLAKSGFNAITMHIVGTQGYVSPEYLADGVVSIKMDVFAFGVVLLELISGREAIDEDGRVLWAQAEGVFRGGVAGRSLEEWMDPCLTKDPSCSTESVSNVMAVAVACLNRDPSKRPTMVDIVYALCKSNNSSSFFDVSDDGSSPGPRVTAR